MSVTIEKLSSSYELAEGPHWHVKSQKLYYVDILKQNILRLDPVTGKITSAYISKLIRISFTY
jgi:sugar lactone lactonase YvrE